MRPIAISSTLTLTLLLVDLAALAFAHGEDENGSMDNSGSNVVETLGPSISPFSTATDAGPHSYFRHQEYGSLMLTHIILMSVSWIFVLPICTMLSIARSRLSLPLQFVFLVMNGFGLAFAAIYNANTPDLYANNAHHKIGWLLVATMCIHTLLAILNTCTTSNVKDSDSEEAVAFIPISNEAIAEHQRIQSFQDDQMHRFSNDSGQGTEPNTESLRDNSLSSLNSVRTSQDSSPHSETNHDVDLNHEKLVKNLNMTLSRLPTILMTSRVRNTFSIFLGIINRSILIFGFVALASGFVTYAGIYRDGHIFSGLAHVIKGGVFFWYGILTLGRWAGCFANLGWAWNIPPSATLVRHRKASNPSAEFVESFLIFFYGCTNVFLEHLAAWGNAWSAQDLEHISIAIMFFGGGMCGMLVESRRIRDMLNSTVTLSSVVQANNRYSAEIDQSTSWSRPKTYSFSMNPLPALIVLLLGLMISSHHQTSMVSTMVHKQWGNLLVGAAFSRVATYIIFYISPPTSIWPSRPPSELITAFCLMAGGLIFMASSADTITAMEFNDLGAMFIFTVTMGFVTFLMAWIILVIAIKGWAMRRGGRSSCISLETGGSGRFYNGFV